MNKAELKTVNELKQQIREKEDTIKRLEKTYKNTKEDYAKIEGFVKIRNPIMINKELKNKLDSLRNDKENVVKNRFINTKTALKQEIDLIRQQLKSSELVRDEGRDVLELEIEIESVKNKVVSLENQIILNNKNHSENLKDIKNRVLLNYYK